jgi:hypothetical protein
VKRIVQRKLAKRKRRIIKRLEKALEQDGEQPTLKPTNIAYELGERTRAISHGGIGAVKLLCQMLGLPKRIDRKLHLLKIHRPYHESDHVLNLAFNPLCGGQTLDDIELRRNDEVYLDALGTESIPDPTTAGDFCRRFSPWDIHALMDAINETRLVVWRMQPSDFIEQTARIDADGTLVSTQGECKQGMDISHKGTWGYHPLLVSLANTQEPLFITNRGANRPSHEGVVPLFDKAVDLCRKAGFADILLRGDTDFSLTSELDRWDKDGVRFTFGYDAAPNLKARADGHPEAEYEELVRHAEREIKTEPRQKQPRVKEGIVRERLYKNIRLESEDIAEFEYQPTKCKKKHRMVVVRKNLSVMRGEWVLFPEIRYFFYITNDRQLSPREVVNEAMQRCNQENLNAQLKGGVRALHAPLNTLNANWAYMVTTALAWSIKAWLALMLPVHGRWREKHTHERETLLKMEFRTFVQAMMAIPAQIVMTGRRTVFRFLAWSPWQSVFFRLVDVLRC